MSKNGKFPFGWSPSHWGLKGKLREVARAEHELEGEAFEREMLRINLAGRNEEEMARVGLRIDLDYKRITEEEYDRNLLELRKPNITEKEYKEAELKLDLLYKKITQDTYDKESATLLEEPFVRCIQISTDPNNPGIGSFALDWNKAFVLYLEEHGYGPAPNDEEIIDQWFTELCKNVALDAFDGIGDFNEKLDNLPHRNPDIVYTKDLRKDKKRDE